MTRLPKPVNPINIIVGQRLRLKRELLGMSQSALGKVLNVSRIKIGQFESGNSAVPASTLYELAEFLQVDVCFFFEETNETGHHAPPHFKELDPLLNRESLSLLKDFGAMDDTDVRKKIAAVMERAAELITEKK